MHALSQLKTSDSLLDVTGPLGMPTEVKQYGTVMVVGGGLVSRLFIQLSRL